MHGQNIQAMREADVVLLAFKPYMMEAILHDANSYADVKTACQGKLVISVLAGTTVSELRGYLSTPQLIVRAMPNLSTSIRQSMTIIEEPAPGGWQDIRGIAIRIFEQLGSVKLLPPDQFDAGVMAMGSSIGLMLTTLEGILDGCVAEGLKRSDALKLASQAMAGTAGLLKNGTQPATLREEIASPRGCTIQTLLRAEKEGVRGSCAQAVIDGAEHLRK